ncbi:hypothetical protein PVAP13_5KG123300 [Panicum virgatum]|uniref:SIAH-type domain-containing protein n=1 Tax=Panicum virgatum TaxID=38727 RepID=A0A8T0SG51_PANVG|nr:hypothetical protein PVAP13_5KG123300 [Panicum virgatum]
MGDKRPWPRVLRQLPGMKRPRGEDETQTVTSQHRAEKITVDVDADLLQCCVCSGPLTAPLFQCTKGHISCSDCCTDAAMADECECLMCPTRCRAMERVLAGVSVPCPFREHECTEMIPYASKEAHEGSCSYAPCHCPIPGCAGYAGKSLIDHVQVDQPDVRRTRVKQGCLTPLRMRSSEQARVVWLDSNCAELLLVAGRDVPGGRYFEVEDELKYRIEVVGKDGVLSLSGPTKVVERLDRPYQASAFLFVPDAIWDSHPEDIPVFIHLK